MDFKTIHTEYGLQLMAAAEAANGTINLTEMAVGDGNGNPTTPAPNQAGLVREMYRAAVNRVYQDPSDKTRFTAELVVPATEAGFTLREVAVIDDQGGLFVVGNLPETYKPNASEGAYTDTVVRVEFIASNASVITLKVDPNVAVATQAWISNNVTAAALIPGGTTGQVLKKASNADGDAVWGDQDVFNITVDTISEQQLLADAQTIVDLAVTTTYGLAVYIDGLRINLGSGADEWEPDPVIETRLTLGQSYTAGTRILCVQNEPAGSAPAPLERSKNLSDVGDKPTARTNLGVHSKAESNAAGQPGDIKYTARNTAPTGWLKANGAAVSRTAYAELFTAIGTVYGDGDGFNTFNLPDLRGEFVRGWDDGRGVDAGRVFGAGQNDDNKSHSHTGSTSSGGSHSHSASSGSAGSHSHTGSTNTAGSHTHEINNAGRDSTLGGYIDQASGNGEALSSSAMSAAGSHSHTVSTNTTGSHSHSVTVSSAGSHSHTFTTSANGGAETRPRNVALLACIKY